jgi:hypothetical protein
LSRACLIDWNRDESTGAGRVAEGAAAVRRQGVDLHEFFYRFRSESLSNKYNTCIIEINSPKTAAGKIITAQIIWLLLSVKRVFDSS